METTLIIQSPVGELTLRANDTAITAIRFGGAGSAKTGADTKAAAGSNTPAEALSETTPLLRQAAQELAEYFSGTRREFTFPLAPAGTEFQQAVWDALRKIPYGETRSYKQIAEQIGRPKACRAVGMANNRNPIAIVVPCHRVVGHDGSLVGYAGGMDVKQTLLKREGSNLF